MNIYTSYFGNIKNIPPHIWPISIARQRPSWYHGPELGILAPSADLFRKYKRSQISWVEFSRMYQTELDSLDPATVYQSIKTLGWGNDVCLLCYERPEERCHRHVLSRWMEEKLGRYIDVTRISEYYKLGGDYV